MSAIKFYYNGIKADNVFYRGTLILNAQTSIITFVFDPLLTFRSREHLIVEQTEYADKIFISINNPYFEEAYNAIVDGKIHHQRYIIQTSQRAISKRPIYKTDHALKIANAEREIVRLQGTYYDVEKQELNGNYFKTNITGTCSRCSIKSDTLYSMDLVLNKTERYYIYFCIDCLKKMTLELHKITKENIEVTHEI
jgi:hypothetical protein